MPASTVDELSDAVEAAVARCHRRAACWRDTEVSTLVEAFRYIERQVSRRHALRLVGYLPGMLAGGERNIPEHRAILRAVAKVEGLVAKSDCSYRKVI